LEAPERQEQSPQEPSQEPSQSPSSDGAIGDGGDGGDVFPRAVVENLRRENAELRMSKRDSDSRLHALEEKMQSAEDEKKTDAEKLQAQLERAQRELSRERQEKARHELAAEKKLPVMLFEFPQPNDRAGLEAYADRLVRYIAEQNELAVESARVPRRATTAVERGTPVTEAPDMNDFIRQGFRR
jgi:hypothetical protein